MINQKSLHFIFINHKYIIFTYLYIINVHLKFKMLNTLFRKKNNCHYNIISVLFSISIIIFD